jgi:hypothetical protein
LLLVIDNPNVNELSSPLLNRFKHYNFVPSVNDWLEWGKEKNTEGEQKVDEYLRRFIEFNKKYFHVTPADEDDVAWASPRTWVAGMDVVKKYLAKNETPNDKTIKIILSGAVGNENTEAFLKFKEKVKQAE